MFTAILVLPLIGAIIAGFFHRFIGEKLSMVIPTTLLLIICALSWYAFFTIHGNEHSISLMRFINSGAQSFFDVRVDTPRTNLDDPGIGLRNNGRQVLTYADLHTIGGPIDARGAEREIELHLTGNMERYSWSLDGLEFGRSTPVHFRYGERLRVVLHNDTMMTHPMHLHGLWSELQSPDGEFMARRHTISVQPAQRVSFLVSVDALGRWAWHCHLLYHMDSGMFRQVVVA